MTASDNFNRANGGLGANWTTVTGTAPAILSNEVIGGALDNGTAMWNGGTWSNDQESSITSVNLIGGLGGPAVRLSTASGGNGYCFLTDNNSFSKIYKIVSGSYSDLSGTSTAHPAVGSVLKLTAVGTTITIYDDGVSIGSVSDASIASGNPGLYINGSGAYLDDWLGADIGGGGGGAVIPVFMNQYRQRR